ncbi:hypothetical protein H0H81_010743 [Sphagnurus paluster]|uniref:Uncharacterized protein n=1 Tax=Sphagnurus paluster TaxID=117069 RepID=A0A9P7K3N4_9AGAR|nr:hypothetical protein H0H81_010743 [Sphagnurus paluster]
MWFALFTRPLRSFEWERFILYARRVKYLQCVTALESSISRRNDPPPAIWKMLLVARPSIMTHILPNLQELVWAVPDAIFPYIRLFFPRTLKKLKLEVMANGMAGVEERFSRLSLLSNLMDICPALDDIKLNYQGRRYGLISEFSESICQWQFLRALHTHCITAQALNRIASFPHLETLSLEEEIHGLGTIPLTTGALPVLRRLKVIMPLEQATTILIAITHPVLESIEVTFPECDWSAWESFFTTVATSSQTLTKLVVKELSGDQNREPITAATFRTLLSLPKISHIVIRPAVRMACIDDQLIKKISEAWPHLRHLELGDGNISAHSPVTLQGLLSLVRGCPDLETLTLTLDARMDKFPLHAPPGMGACSPKLTKLRLGHSLIRNPENVALFLADVFPNLKTVEAATTGWAAALKFTELYKAVRKWPTHS